VVLPIKLFLLPLWRSTLVVSNNVHEQQHVALAFKTGERQSATEQEL
jgi:hypothetical protein